MFDCTPEVFDEINFAMIFRQEHTDVSRGLDCLLDKGLLVLEIGLEVQYSLGAAVGPAVVASPFAALQIQPSLPEAAFLQNYFRPFGHIWKIGVCRGKYHWLSYFLSVLDKPPITHFRLFPARIEINVPGEKCVARISGMPL